MTIWNMKITAAESPQTVHIPLEGKYYAIKNSGEHDILVSSSVANPTEGADDVMKILSGSAAIIPVKDGDLYVSAEEDGAYSISIQDDKVIPWSGGTGSGGGGGDNTHYKGTTTTPLENGSTTNPIVIDGESYTAVFGDVVVYGYTEFVFDGTAWSEFGRPFDTTPTSGSTNAVTSDGVYRNTAGRKYYVNDVLKGEAFNGSNVASAACSHAEGSGTTASGGCSHAEGLNSTASGANSHAEGNRSKASGDHSHAEGSQTIASGLGSHAGGIHTIANRTGSTAIGRYNVADTDVIHLLIVGKGADENSRSNILEVSMTDMNVNGDIKVNNVTIPTPYTTMPTITADMLGKIAQYVGTTGGGFTQGCFYVASTDGAAEPTYSWVQIGGGRTETVLWENEGTTNPETVTLSEPITNFDEVVIEATYAGDAGNYRYTNTWLVSADLVGMRIQLNDETQYCAYTLTTSTTFADHSGTRIVVSKIIGIKY